MEEKKKLWSRQAKIRKRRMTFYGHSLEWKSRLTEDYQLHCVGKSYYKLSETRQDIAEEKTYDTRRMKQEKAKRKLESIQQRSRLNRWFELRLTKLRGSRKTQIKSPHMVKRKQEGWRKNKDFWVEKIRLTSFPQSKVSKTWKCRRKVYKTENSYSSF